MKTSIPSRRAQRGTILLICLFSAALIGIALASYLTLAQQEYVTTYRSQTWNRTMPVTEAGVEDAMALINKYAGTGTPLTSWTNTAAADGWTSVGNVFHTRRYVKLDYYDVYITNLNNAPAIKSIGTLTWTYAGTSLPQPTFAAIGTSIRASTNITRSVLIQTTNRTSFLFGILARKGITISGGGTNDSINSLDSNYLTNPWSMALEHANGSIGTLESNVSSAFGESSSTIYGHVYTGPGSTVTVSGGSGGIGDASWLASNPGKIEPGWTNNTLNISVPEAPTAPNATYLPLPPPILNTYVLTGSGISGIPIYYYASAGLNISGGATVLVTNGAVVLKCLGDFTLSGGSDLLIAKGASLTAYLNGKTTLSGGGVINGSEYATNCAFYGSTNCTSITYSGSSDFIGTVWAPEADYVQSGGSGFIGAIIANTFNQSGGKSLMRYDESLGNGGLGSVYRVVSWQEVPP